jgi:hypothetical protein
MKYPHSIPLWRTNEELLPASALSRLVLSSLGTRWNDILLEQHNVPSSELADVTYKRHVAVINIGHSTTWEFKKEGRFSALLQGKRRDFLLPEPSAFFWSAEGREGRICKCSLSGSGPCFREPHC